MFKGNVYVQSAFNMKIHEGSCLFLLRLLSFRYPILEPLSQWPSHILEPFSLSLSTSHASHGGPKEFHFSRPVVMVV